MSAFATKQKPPRQDLDAFTTNVFATDTKIAISDVEGLNGTLATKIGANDTITLTNKTIDGDLNTVQDLQIASTTNLQNILDSKVEASTEDTFTNKTINGNNNTLSNISINSVSNLSSTLNSRLPLNANYTTSGIGFYTNGLKLGLNATTNCFNVKDDNSPSGYSVPSGLVTIPSRGFLLEDDGDDDYMFIDRFNQRLTLGKGQEENTKQKGISINTTGLNTWSDGTSIVDLAFLDNDIVLASNDVVSPYNGNDGSLYPCRPRTNTQTQGGFYVKPIRTDATNKSLTSTSSTYPEAQSNYILHYNDRTGEVMKRDVASTAMKIHQLYIGSNGVPNLTSQTGASNNANDNLTAAPLAVSTQASNIRFYSQRRYRYDTGSNTNEEKEDNQTSAVFEGRILTENGMWVSSDERIKQNMADVNDDSALRIINAIEPKSYEYIDHVARTSERVYGFSAQQVYSVLPNAVSIQHEYIPNLMCDAVVEGTLLTLEDVNTLSLNYTDADGTAYASVKAFGKGKNATTYLKVINVDSSSNTCVIADEIEPHFMETDENGNNIIFLYGQNIPDFHKLDKSAIFTLSISAIQEIHRVQQQQAALIELQSSKLSALQEQVRILESHVSLP